MQFKKSLVLLHIRKESQLVSERLQLSDIRYLTLSSAQNELKEDKREEVAR